MIAGGHPLLADFGLAAFGLKTAKAAIDRWAAAVTLFAAHGLRVWYGHYALAKSID